MTHETKKSIAYNLIIDEKRADILTLMLGAFSALIAVKPELFYDKDKREAMLIFIKGIADKTHDAGWCKDPNCDREK